MNVFGRDRKAVMMAAMMILMMGFQAITEDWDVIAMAFDPRRC